MSLDHSLSYGNIGILQAVDNRTTMPLHSFVIGVDNSLQSVQRHIANILVVVEQKSAKNIDRKNLEARKGYEVELVICVKLSARIKQQTDD